MPIYIYICFAVWTAVNITEILLCGIDKLRAKRDAWRIPEKVLLTLGFLGGSLGLMLGMILFHHKISKPAFRYGAPAMALFHTILLVIGLYFFSARYFI